MKKLFFSAVALIAFSSVSMANTIEIEKENIVTYINQAVVYNFDDIAGSCVITVTWTDSNGNQNTRRHFRDADSEEECGYAADAIRLAYEVGLGDFIR